MEEERGMYCNAVGMRVKEGRETYGGRWEAHRRWGLLEVVLASKMIYDPKTSLLTPKQTSFLRDLERLWVLEESDPVCFKSPKALDARGRRTRKAWQVF
jgi:hypothetical protein